nr:oxygenase MpaB family protein [Phytoactinopolyspora limicola]
MSSDVGLFGPDSVSWRVHREPILWVAGVRALYLQALHPWAVAAVAQNSDYRTGAWARFIRTADYVATVVFGTTADAHAAGARVRRIHEHLRATDPVSGRIYRVDEPPLLRWVHVCEVNSFVTTAQRAGVPLSGADVDHYYAEQVRAAELVGLSPDDVPASGRAVAEYFTDIQSELALTSEARDVARFLTFPPMPRRYAWAGGRPAWLVVAGLAFTLLPRWAQRLYGTPPVPGVDTAASLTVRGLRQLTRVLPIREGPIYRDALRRAEAHTEPRPTR